MNKFILAEEKRQIYIPATKSYIFLYRIEACKDILDPAGNLIVRSGEKGGWLQSENNLSQDGSCWVFDDAYVFDSARVSGDAIIKDYAKVSGVSIIKDFAVIQDNSIVYSSFVLDHAIIQDASVVRNTKVANNALVYNGASANRSTISDDAKVSGPSSVEDSFIKDNATISNGAQVLSGSTVGGEAKILSCATVSNSKVFGDAVIKDNSYVSDSSIQGKTTIRNKSSVLQSTVKNCPDIAGTTVIEKCYVDIKALDRERCKMFYSDAYFYDLVLDASTILSMSFISKRETPLKKDSSILITKKNITIKWSNYLPNFSSNREYSVFSDYADTINFLLKKMPINPDFFCTKKEATIARYIKKIFSDSKNIENMSEQYATRFLSLFYASAPKAKKTEIASKKNELLFHFKNYFFSLLVKFYVVVATANKERNNFFVDNDDLCSLFINSSDIDILTEEITCFNAEVLYDEAICEFAAKTCDFSTRSSNKLKKDISEYEKSFPCNFAL